MNNGYSGNAVSNKFTNAVNPRPIKTDGAVPLTNPIVQPVIAVYGEDIVEKLFRLCAGTENPKLFIVIEVTTGFKLIVPLANVTFESSIVI